MFSRASPERPTTEDRDARLARIARLCASRLGLDLARYPAAQITALLDALPESPGAGDEAWMARILAACCIGETTFMRHPEQLEALRRMADARAIGEPGRPLSIWSAGCSTGEEAYSLAAVLASHPGGVRVLGTDVNAQAIERARTGRYRHWSLRGVDPRSTAGFLEVAGLDAIVRDEVRARVELSAHNLAVDPYPKGLDVIVCRNVLLYFGNEAAAAVLAGFHASLRPGGVLLLGYFDPAPVADRAPFAEEESCGVRHFRKLSAPARRPPTIRPRPPEVSALARPENERARLQERLTLVRSLSGGGAHAEALRLLEALVRDDPLEVEPHVLTAMVADEAGEAELALEAARRAYFLTHAAPVPAFLLAMCLSRAGFSAQAKLRLAEARRALERAEKTPGPLPYGEGMTAIELRRTIDALIEQK
ncbi:CheR family methyltransferase [Polyangium aurulentum]|uniref:CheR family methyltransferase n=1 Tax=Polyangium aurulentum TaxID=2567896 RepID=UPI0010ADF74A|nr:CheR family methyltransferase [Polyangium aurulentum]UQA62431.1 hypothetical protein E8A73_019020 [Polyangium aurulentum]